MRFTLSTFILAVLILSCNNASEGVAGIFEDKGILAKPPTWSEEAPDIETLKERNIFSVFVKSDGTVLARDEPRKVSELTILAKQFISNPDQEEGLAESPKLAIISLKSDRETNYALYLEVYNALKRAYDELWDEKARELFGLPYTMDMPYEQRRMVKQAIPMVLSEAEPTSFDEE